LAQVRFAALPTCHLAMLGAISMTLEDLMMAAPRIEVQLTLAGIQAVIWHIVIFRLLPPHISGFINSMRSKERFLKNSAMAFKKMFMLDLSHDQDALFDFTVLFQAILSQHLIGGLLCLPSVLGCQWASPSVASALACHGALCEVGWEIQDFVVRLKEIIFDGEAGRKKNPASWMAVLVFHHTIAQCLVLPLNIYYRDNVYYHEAVFLLQAASVVAMVCQSYGFTLDVSQPAERVQMQVVVTVGFVLVLWARLLRYGYIWYVLIASFRADGNDFVLKMAITPFVLGSLFNLLLVSDFYRKFKKFVLARDAKAGHRGQKLPEQGMRALQAAAPVASQSSPRAAGRRRRCEGQRSTRPSLASGRAAQICVP